MTVLNDALLTPAGDYRTVFALARGVRRVARLAVLGFLMAAAVMSGLMVGRLGQGTKRVRSIAPTLQPVRRQTPDPREAPWPLSETGPGAR